MLWYAAMRQVPPSSTATKLAVEPSFGGSGVEGTSHRDVHVRYDDLAEDPRGRDLEPNLAAAVDAPEDRRVAHADRGARAAPRMSTNEASVVNTAP